MRPETQNLPLIDSSLPEVDLPASFYLVSGIAYSLSSRLLSSVEGQSMDDDTASEGDGQPVVWETSFTEQPPEPEPEQTGGNGPAVSNINLSLVVSINNTN